MTESNLVKKWKKTGLLDTINPMKELYACILLDHAAKIMIQLTSEDTDMSYTSAVLPAIMKIIEDVDITIEDVDVIVAEIKEAYPIVQQIITGQLAELNAARLDLDASYILFYSKSKSYELLQKKYIKPYENQNA